MLFLLNSFAEISILWRAGIAGERTHTARSQIISPRLLRINGISVFYGVNPG